MANIGNFTADKDGFTGTLRTLTLNVEVKLVPNDKGEHESAPDFRLQATGHDFEMIAQRRLAIIKSFELLPNLLLTACPRPEE